MPGRCNGVQAQDRNSPVAAVTGEQTGVDPATGPRTGRSWEWLWSVRSLAPLTAISYYAAAKLGVALRPAWAPFAMYWPAAGIAVGAVVIALSGGDRRRRVGAVMSGLIIAITLANWGQHDAVLIALLVAANVTEAAVASFVFIRLSSRWEWGPRSIASLAAAAVVGSGISSIIATAGIVSESSASTWTIALGWFTADVAGIIVVAPALLSLTTPHARGDRRVAVWSSYAVAFVAACLLAFVLNDGYPLAFVPVVVIVWGAIALGSAWSCLSIVALSVITAVATSHRRGPFIGNRDELLLILTSQLFLGAAALTTLSVASIVEQRARIGDRVERHRTLLRLMIEENPQGIVLYDADCRPISANQALLDFFGVSLEQLRGDEPLPPGLTASFPNNDTMSLAERPSRRALDSREAIRHERVRIHRADGTTVDLSVDAIPIARRAGELPWAVLAIHDDVTTERQAEIHREHLVAGVSHELRTPLAAIRASLELLQPAITDPGDERILSLATTNVGRLGRIIEDLLEYERFSERSPELNIALHHTRDLVIACFSSLGTAALTSGIELHHDGDAEVHVDGDRIIQVLTNLVANAIKFSTAPGRVDVRCGPAADEHWVRIEVTDHGRGIPAASLERIFDRFEQVEPNDAARGGLGLGLPIAQAIVSAHGGVIGAHSTLGKGATFTFTVPAASATSALDRT